MSVEVPYLHVVSPSEDWLISPQINTKVAPLLNLQWRRRFANGMIVARGGYTNERNFGDFDIDGDGRLESNVRFGDRENRSYLLSHGEFDPDGPWRFGFTAERTSDKTLFDRYDIRSPYQDNGLYYGDRRRLISQIYAEHQTDRSLCVGRRLLDPEPAARPRLRRYRFPRRQRVQGVRGRPHPAPVAPLIDARWEPHELVMGGRLRLKGSAVSLYRDRFVGAPILNPEIVPPVTAGLTGVDSRRITGQLEWRRTVILPIGVRVEPFVDTRVDLYSMSNLPPMMGIDSDATISRSRLSAGVDVTYPLIKRARRRRYHPGAGRPVLGVQQGQSDPRIPIEDAQVLELDESSLFRMDRFSGYDLLEGGARLTAGGRATIRWSEGRKASLFIGRSYRFQQQDDFRTSIPDAPARLYDPTGLASETSDWVVQGDFLAVGPDPQLVPPPLWTVQARFGAPRPRWTVVGDGATWPPSAISWISPTRSTAR